MCLLLLVAPEVSAETFGAPVIGIADGDTITVLDSSNQQYRIRLAGIDAPEHNQAFGTRSKQNLSRLVFGKTVTLDCGKEESYGRLVCKVLLPNGEDVCLDQVKAGMAWHYPAQLRIPGPAAIVSPGRDLTLSSVKGYESGVLKVTRPSNCRAIRRGGYELSLGY